MSNIVSKKLSIDKNNIAQYCEADNVSFDVTGHTWRKWLNGSSDGYVILKDEGKAVIYPTDTAHPFKADSLISASRSAGSCKVELLVGGTSVHSESYTSGSQTQKSKSDITDSAITNSTKATEIKWHVNGANANNQRGDLIELTLYFYQYTMSVNVGTDANGIQNVSVTNAAPYYGDSVTFSAVLVKGSTWYGWYSDAACTTLVSSDQNYTVSPSSDLTLYAKATTDSTLYNCSAVAGAEISSVSVSDAIVPESETAVFTAQVNTGCSFEAWYSDDTYTTVVSTENPYTATITADTTLYAKAHKNELHMSAGTAEHGTATVSAATVTYGSDVTFTFTPEDETWELYGWYSDSGLTQLVSEANPYTFTATEDTALYPKIDKKKYTITLTTLSQFKDSVHTLLSCDLNSLTSDEYIALKRGNLDSISQDKIFDKQTVTSSFLQSKTISIKCPDGYAVGMSATNSNDAVTVYFSLNNEALTNWPYYMTIPTGNQDYQSVKNTGTCLCSATGLDGIISAYVPSHVAQGKEAIFEAEVMPGYVFQGWYDSAGRLTDSNNPASIKTPVDSSGDTIPDVTSLPLYAKATKATYTIGVGESEYCTTSVSATTAQYGDVVTFECVPSTHYSFKGWYADERLKQLVSESASYQHTVTDSVILYPRIDCTICLALSPGDDGTKNYCVKTAILDFDMLTQAEIECLKTGDYEVINADKVYEIRDETGLGVKDSNGVKKSVNVSCPVGKTCAVFGYLPNSSYMTYLEMGGNITYWPYMWFAPYLRTYTIYVHYAMDIYMVCPCNCTAISGEGVAHADATSPTAQGKNAVFTAEVETGHKFDGWYSDEACTVLVSSENPAEITTPESTEKPKGATSLTLYAKATAGNFYNCTAIAKSSIKSVTVSSPQTTSGEQCTFTAQLDSGREFVGWYSDEECTQLVSTENPYTATILADTTLYAKGKRIFYTFSVDTVAHCSSSVSPSTAYYEDIVEFQCNPDTDYEFVGWYLNEDRADGNRITTSSSFSYTCMALVEFYEYVNGPLEGAEIKLWPKVAVKPPTISISITGMNTVGVKIAAVDYDNLSETEIGYLKTGEYDKISASKVHATDSAFCKESLMNNTATATVQCPVGMYISMYVSGLTVGNTVYYGYVENYTWWPYYWYKPEQDASFTAGLNANTQLGECICTAVAKEGVSSADATSPIVSTKEAVFSAKVASGYSFVGWYSDEDCTVCVSTENPAKVAAPQESKSGLFRPNSALTLYAKATPIGSQSTGLSLKLNGSWVEAKTVYRKVDGVWAQQDNPKVLFSGSSSGSASNYIYCGEASS